MIDILLPDLLKFYCLIIISYNYTNIDINIVKVMV